MKDLNVKKLRSLERGWNDPDIKNPRLGNVHMIKCIDLDDLGYFININPRPRLWYKPELLTYTSKHYYYSCKDPRDKGDEQLSLPKNLEDVIVQSNKYKSLTITHLQMFHDHACRSEEREKRRQYYETEELPKLEE